MVERRIIRGAIWAGLGSWAGSLVSFLVFVATARLLGPEAFGIIALAWVVLSFVDMFLGKTITETLVQRDPLNADHSNSCFWIAVFVAIALTALLSLVAEPLASLFDRDDLADVLRVYAFLLIPIGLRAVPLAMLRRALRFREIAATNMASLIAAGLTAVAMAASGFGVWSLVASAFVEYTLTLALFWRAAGWRPTGFIRWSAVQEMRAFATNTFLAALITQATMQIPRLAVGAYLGVAALGVFVIAWNAFERINTLLLAPVRNVALPAVATMRKDVEQFRHSFLRTLSFSTNVTYPVFLGAAAVAPLAIPLIFGSQWAQSGIAAQVLLFIGLRSAVTELNGAVIKGFDRTDLTITLSIINLILISILVWIALPYGLVAVAIAVLVRRLATWPLSAYYVYKVCRLTVRQQLTAGAPAFAAAIGMFTAVLAIEKVLLAAAHPVLILAVMVIAGAAIYPSLLYFISSAEEREDFKNLVRRLASRDVEGIKRFLFS